MCAAVHARGIVGNDAAHHCRADAGRIRRENTSQRFQDLVDPRAYDTRLQGNAIGIRGDCIVFPVFARHDEDAVAHALPRQGRACRTEGKRQPKLVRRLDNLRHLGLVLGADDHLWRQPVKTRVSTPCQCPQLVGINPIPGQKRPYFIQEPFHSSLNSKILDGKCCGKVDFFVPTITIDDGDTLISLGNKQRGNLIPAWRAVIK